MNYPRFLLIYITLAIMQPFAVQGYTTPSVYVTEGSLSPSGGAITGTITVENRSPGPVGDIVAVGSLITVDANARANNLYAERALSEPFSLNPQKPHILAVNMPVPDTLPKSNYILRVQLFLKNSGTPLGRKDFSVSATTLGGAFLLSDLTSLAVLLKGESYTPGYGPTVYPDDPAPIMKGTMRNTGSDTGTFTPHWTIQDRTPFETVLEETTAEAVSVAGSSTYSFQYAMPSRQGGSYLVSLWFTDAQGIQTSDVMRFRYVGSGVSGKIISATLDKTSYAKGEQALVNITYSGSADRESTLNPRFSVRIEDTEGVCAAQNIRAEQPTRGSAALLIERQCDNPTLSVQYFSDDTLLDEMKATFVSEGALAPRGISMNPILVVVILTILALILGIIVFVTKKSASPAVPLAILAVLAAGAFAGRYSPVTAHITSLGDDPSYFSQNVTIEISPTDFAFTQTWNSVPGAVNYRVFHYNFRPPVNNPGDIKNHADLAPIAGPTQSDTYLVPRGVSSSFKTQVIAEDATQKPIAFSDILHWDCDDITGVCVNNPSVGNANYEPIVAASNPMVGSTFSAGQSITVDGDVVSMACLNMDADAKIAVYFEQGGVSTLIGSSGPYDHGAVLSVPFSVSGVAIPAGANSGPATIRLHAVYYYGATFHGATPATVGYPTPIAHHELIIPVTITGGNTPPSVSITAPTNGAVFTTPATVTIAANASDPGGTVTQVEFFRDGTPIGSPDTSPPYGVSWNNVPAGSYSLTARATDNDGASTNSAPVNITVNAAPPPPPANVTATLNCSQNRIDVGWSPQVAGADTYSAYYCDANVSGPSCSPSTSVASDVAPTIPHSTALIEGHVYRYRIRSSSITAGVGSFSTSIGSAAYQCLAMNITATPGRILAGQSTTLVWSSGGAASCTVFRPDGTPLPGGTGTQSPIGPPPGVSTGPLPAGNHTFTLTCTALDGVTQRSTQTTVTAASPSFEEF